MGHYRQCIKCGERFTAHRATRRFCSDRCRLKYHRSVWNDPSGGQLSTLLRRVADSIDNGHAARAQVSRLRTLLATYDRDLMANDLVRYLDSQQRRARKASA